MVEKVGFFSYLFIFFFFHIMQTQNLMFHATRALTLLNSYHMYESIKTERLTLRIYRHATMKYIQHFRMPLPLSFQQTVFSMPTASLKFEKVYTPHLVNNI